MDDTAPSKPAIAPDRQVVLATSSAVVQLAYLLMRKGLIEGTELADLLDSESADFTARGHKAAASYIHLMANAFREVPHG